MYIIPYNSKQEGQIMEVVENLYKPEFNLLADAYLGCS